MGVQSGFGTPNNFFAARFFYELKTPPQYFDKKSRFDQSKRLSSIENISR